MIQYMINYADPFLLAIKDITRTDYVSVNKYGKFLNTGTESNPWLILTNGCRVANKRGLSNAVNQLKKLEADVEELIKTYDSVLKLQYTSILRFFCLFTVLSLPTVLLCKYWAMNYENMQDDVSQFWIWWIVINTILFTLCFHYKFLN